MEQEGGLRFPREVSTIDSRFGLSLSPKRIVSTMSPVLSNVISPAHVVSPVFTPQYYLTPPIIGRIKPVKYPLISSFRPFLPTAIFTKKFAVLVVLKSGSSALITTKDKGTLETGSDIRKVLADTRRKFQAEQEKNNKNNETIKQLQERVKQLEQQLVVQQSMDAINDNAFGGAGETYELLLRKDTAKVDFYTGTETSMHQHILSYTDNVIDLQKIAPTTTKKILFDNALIYVVVLNKYTIPAAFLDRLMKRSTLVNLENVIKVDISSQLPIVTDVKGKRFYIRQRMVDMFREKVNELKGIQNSTLKVEQGKLAVISE
jgi:hypothetical protein